MACEKQSHNIAVPRHVVVVTYKERFLRFTPKAVIILRPSAALPIFTWPPFDFEWWEKSCRVADLRHAYSLERAAFKMFVPDCFDEMSQWRFKML
jgi:hypothetical protein